MNANLSTFLPLCTSPLIVIPTTGHGKELEELWRRKGEQDAQFELIFEVNVIETWCSLCSASSSKPSKMLYCIASYRLFNVLHVC